jgi:phosphoribosylpyrophosphate synthetase
VEVVSINVGKPASIKFQNKELYTGIVKSPVSSDLYLSQSLRLSLNKRLIELEG